MSNQNTVTQDQINELLENAFVETYTIFGKTTVVAVKLENGFVIIESSSCVDPANYDHKIGFDICMARIANKLWEMEGYKLQSAVHESYKLLTQDDES